MPFESQTHRISPTDSGFTQMVFEDLQTEYPKDPARFSKMYFQLKHEADATQSDHSDRTDSRQNLCLLDLAIANMKAKSGDHQEAQIMFVDALSHLKVLEKDEVGKTTKAIQEIAETVRGRVN